MMRDLRALAAALLLPVLLCPALRAQDAESGDSQDYQKMMQQMMKSANYSQTQEETWDARLKVVSGSVMVKPSDSEEWSKITGEMPLEHDDAVKTGPDGVAELYLDDKGAISLGRNTQVEMTSLDQTDAVFSLTFGSLVAKVKKLMNEKFKLQVRTPNAVCAVRGTEFAVEYAQMGKETSVAVFDEGRVAVTPQAEGEGEPQEYTLEKNTELLLSPGKKRFRPVALARMARHKGMVGQMRGRLAAFKGWKPRTQAKRAALRDQALKRRIIRKQLREKAPAKAKARRSARARAAARRAAAERKAGSEAQAAEELQEPGQE
ncbi:MAG: FecR family protein [Elusimicrobiales bacterium]|nr:FecR family protein [Elusimicrobiales bacterium]